MKKTFELEDLDCANCAAKMAEEIRKIDVEADDAEFDSIMKKAVKVCRRVEPDCRIILK